MVEYPLVVQICQEKLNPAVENRVVQWSDECLENLPLDLGTIAEIFDILGDLLPPRLCTDDLLHLNTVSEVLYFQKH